MFGICRRVVIVERNQLIDWLDPPREASTMLSSGFFAADLQTFENANRSNPDLQAIFSLCPFKLDAAFVIWRN